MRRIGLIVLASIAALPVVAIIAYFAWMIVCDAQDRASWGSKPFSTQEWKSADRHTRYRYVDDLIKSRKLNGLSAEEVRALLGPPDHENFEGFRYLLKPMDCYWDDWTLDIDIEDGKVKEYVIRQT